MAPLMVGQPPVAVVPGGGYAVANHDRRHARSRGALLLPAAVSGQADEVSAPRGGAFLLAQGISSQTPPLRWASVASSALGC